MPGRVSVILKTRPREAEAYVLERLGLVVKKAAFDIEGQAKQRAPYVTGNLYNSIQASQEDPLTWRVDVGAEYGIYVELGTRFAAAQPYLLPATEMVRPAFLEAVRRTVSG